MTFLMMTEAEIRHRQKECDTSKDGCFTGSFRKKTYKLTFFLSAHLNAALCLLKDLQVLLFTVLSLLTAVVFKGNPGVQH